MAATSLPVEQEASYTVIIDGILAVADLNTISAKKIREGLQKAVPYDITPQKDAIKELIMKRFDVFHAEQAAKAKQLPPVKTGSAAVHKVKQEVAANGKDSSSASPTASKRKADSEEADTTESHSAASPPPKKKIRKAEESDADAVLAAKLQAEENARSRPTRGGGNRKAPPAPKKKSKKSKSKVNAEDDSDVEGGVVERKVNRNSGFHKELILSPPLSELLGGAVKLSRPQATKKLWEYIKANELQDPADKRQIRCDDAMRAIFKTDSINMFKMTKAMNQNMYNEGE